MINSGDQAGAVRAMTAKMSFVDASRIGIWGWSGGGSSTLNAMFRYPDIYKMGMAVAPEAESAITTRSTPSAIWACRRITPEDYKKGSPITYVDGLKGDLLIVHGTGDDNVHYQATEYLINALVAKNKRVYDDGLSEPDTQHFRG